MIQPEYFDIVGFVLFIVLLTAGIKIVRKEKIEGITVISIAVLGLLADGYILINKFILR